MMGRFFSIFGLLFLSSQFILAQSTHRIREGESLWTIARQYGLTINELKEANKLESDVIWEGRTLRIPAPRPEPVPEPAPVEIPPLRPEPDFIPLGKPIPVDPIPAPTPAPRAAPRRATYANGGKEAVLRLQVTLDRAGFGPGVIDGKEGYFTLTALQLCRTWNPSALAQSVEPLQEISYQSSWERYLDRSLPGTEDTPDFTALSENQRPLKYYRMAELLAERFHCKIELLEALNPTLDLENLPHGETLLVPNVTAFEIENYLSPIGVGQWSGLVGHGKGERWLEVAKDDKFLYLWENERVVRAFPITINAAETPPGVRTLGHITPGPPYERRKTGYDLLPGPNSPVGVIWAPLGDGYGIHGTSNPDSIGRSVSSGCIRLANWDVVRLAGLIRKGQQVRITGR
ncbi:L,D-transpeptidase family protein [Roseibacillus ishigakijimensis]|uniref:L,D-transpeptidase family protein n=1 Tax=Roseibacillus ishigakijimensis TaxID=454146 RepID=A0A934RKS5_9BACT|nr:L,D-transpeptidase family protein [Roseibacillus ishigakijimensis]MBK1833234.1 L,D-transpeptidase family protein [Roseibacillus ishigakijimensis]